MPIYEYDCKNCGGNFDKLVRSASAATTVTCPTCDSGEVKKRLSVFSSKLAGGSTGAYGSSTASSAANCAPGGL